MDIKGIGELYIAGDLNSALDHAKAFVRDNPEDPNGRGLLMQFYLFAGEQEKALKQLAIIEQQNKDDLPSYLTLKVITEMLKADMQRQAFFANPTEVPAIYEEDKACLQPGFELLKGYKQQKLLPELREKYLGSRPQPLFMCNTGSQEITGELVEPDDLTAFACEVFMAKQGYGWLPWDKIESIEFYPYEKPIDLVYRKATVHRINETNKSADPLHVYVPAIYAGTPAHNTQASLARSTDWVSCDRTELVRGVGQKCILIGDEMIPVLQLLKLSKLSG